METCEACGFVWETVADTEIAERIVSGADALAAILTTPDMDALARRPEPDRWSVLEYGAHLGGAGEQSVSDAARRGGG